MKNSPWLDAFIDPAGLLLLGASIISGLLSAWWMFPVGILLWLVMVINILRDPSLRINTAIQNRSELSQRFQIEFNRMQKSQVTFFNSIQSSENEVQRSLLPINEAISELLDVVYENCKRYSILENHRLVSVPLSDLKENLASVEMKMNAQSSSEEKSHIEATKKILEDKINQHQKVIDQLDKFNMELATIQSQLEGYITDALHAQSANDVDGGKTLAEISRKIRHLSKMVDQR